MNTLVPGVTALTVCACLSSVSWHVIGVAVLQIERALLMIESIRVRKACCAPSLRLPPIKVHKAPIRVDVRIAETAVITRHDDGA